MEQQPKPEPLPSQPAAPGQQARSPAVGQPAQPAKPTVGFDEFAKLDLRVAKVLAVRDHPNADKLIVLDIDLGDQRRQIIAGLKPYLTPESLVGKDVIVVTNLEPRKVRGLESNGMLLAASYDQDGQRRVVVLTTDQPVPPGAVIS